MNEKSILGHTSDCPTVTAVVESVKEGNAPFAIMPERSAFSRLFHWALRVLRLVNGVRSSSEIPQPLIFSVASFVFLEISNVSDHPSSEYKLAATFSEDSSGSFDQSAART